MRQDNGGAGAGATNGLRAGMRAAMRAGMRLMVREMVRAAARAAVGPTAARAVAGVAITLALGGATAVLLARAGWAWAGALLALAVLLGLARRLPRLLAGAPARPGPMAWSTYDRRRSGRRRMGLHPWAGLRARRTPRPPADAGSGAGRAGPLVVHLAPPRADRPADRPADRQRDVR